MVNFFFTTQNCWAGDELRHQEAVALLMADAIAMLKADGENLELLNSLK
jgi:hypothetical protein